MPQREKVNTSPQKQKMPGLPPCKHTLPSQSAGPISNQHPPPNQSKNTGLDNKSTEDDSESNKKNKMQGLRPPPQDLLHQEKKTASAPASCPPPTPTRVLSRRSKELLNIQPKKNERISSQNQKIQGPCPLLQHIPSPKKKTTPVPLLRPAEPLK